MCGTKFMERSTPVKANNKRVGDLGENLACKYLKGKGFSIIEQNYWRKWGEIDIVAQHNSIVHFVEVKTVSHETKAALVEAVREGGWRPDEQVHQFKLGQIRKAAESWISDNHYQGDVQIDVLALRIVMEEQYATVKHISNIIE